MSENRLAIKSYSKSQIAIAYDRSVATITNWIKRNPALLQELKETGYDKFQKEFTVKQVEIIFRHLGTPYEYENKPKLRKHDDE